MATQTKHKDTDVSTTFKWNLLNMKVFIDTLISVTLCADVYELKNHIMLECIWKEMEKKLKIDHNLLKNFWNYTLHLKLFCPTPIYFNDVKIKLIKYMYQNKITNTKDIKWHNVVSCFNGFTHPYLFRVFHNLLKVARTKTNSIKTEDLIRYLHDKYILYLIKIPEDKKLSRLVYNEDKLSYIDEELQEIIAYKIISNSSWTSDEDD